MIRETLDEAIDRVAATLTTRPPDAAAAARLQERLASDTRRVPLWLAVPAAAAVVTLAVMASLLRAPTPSVTESVAESPGAAAAVTQAGDIVMSASRPAPVTRVARQPRTRVDHGAGEADPAIPLVPPPTPLVIEELTFEPLWVAAVELDALDVAVLEVPEIESVGELREQP
jgi:hypothetical protein